MEAGKSILSAARNRGKSAIDIKRAMYVYTVVVDAIAGWDERKSFAVPKHLVIFSKKYCQRCMMHQSSMELDSSR